VSKLAGLKPRRRDRIMDAVEAAGLDVSEWAISPMGAANPKYCYEWAFADEQRSNVVLCLWFEDCELDPDGAVVQRGNIRPLILQLEGQGTPRARRARRFDEILQDAWRLSSKIRVALVDRSDAAKRKAAGQDVSHAAFRQLDPVAWRLASYDMMTGEYLLRRDPVHSEPATATDAADVDGFATDVEDSPDSGSPNIHAGRATGQMDYVCRIVYSNNGWVRPAAAFQEAADSFASTRGFGHEEWLFRDEWTIGGWRYAFLQGVNDSYERLCRQGAPFSVTLFTRAPDVGHRYVARMFGVEVLCPDDARRAVEEFRRRGWFDVMRAEIAAVGGRTEALGDDVLATHMLNLRYRPDRVERLKDMPVAMQDDPVRRIRRYTLCGSKNIGLQDQVGVTGGHEPKTTAYFRNGTEPSWVTPEHGAIQEVLRRKLRDEFPDAIVRCEVGGVDVLLETDRERVFFEVKSELCTRRVIREALGQVMEYAFYRPHDDDLDVRLVVVGRSAASSDDIAYLRLLKERFGIPVDYRQVTIDSARTDDL
jgi:hypothetical protein